MKVQDNLCFYCEQPIWTGSPVTFRQEFRVSEKLARLFQCTAEHLEARSLGGETSLANIVAACWYCNVQRHRAKSPLDPGRYKEKVLGRLRRGRWMRLPDG